MTLNYIILTILLSPLAFLATAMVSLFQPGLRPKLMKKMSTASSVLTIISSIIGGYFVYQYGLIESSTIGFNNLGLSIRLDALSSIMFSMISIIGFIVVKFTQNYLDGDDNQGKFIGRLSATIASVQLLVISGNLGLLFLTWVITSISLHRLLVFYKDRPGGFIAARKKSMFARLGDMSLLGAVFMLYSEFGTGNLEVIFQGISAAVSAGTVSSSVEIAALLFALSALLKSAQFPTHGWLIEVMETPTPVSALLHAGLLNAGPFLLIRMAFVMEASTYAPFLIIAIGGFTALFASVVFLTQTSIKTALGYSSVAHMGFSLMVCGLGAYPAAMLHLVAHSFYKAHAFLSSGSVIDTLRANKVKRATRTGKPIKIALGILLALTVYSSFALAYGIDPIKDLALLTIGGIIVLGLSTLFTSALDSNGSINLVLRASLLAIIVAVSFFTLESAAHFLLSSQLPESMPMSLAKMILAGIVLIAFSAAVFIQILSPFISNTSTYRAFAIHLRNGFYANAIFDRLIGSLSIRTPQNKPISLEKIELMRPKESIVIKRFEEQTA